MATILCLTSCVPGILYPGVELARRLTAAGHNIHYATFADGRATVEGQALTYEPLADSRYDAFLAEDSRHGALWRWRHRSERRRRAVDALALDDLEPMLQRIAPDLILIDGEMHEHILVIAASGIRWSPMNCFISIWRASNLPPPHHLVLPGNGWKGSRPAIAMLWWELRWRKMWRRWTRGLRRAGCDRVSLLRHLARRHGVSLPRLADTSQWLMPYTYRRQPALSLHPFAFELPHRPPDHVHFIGPLLLEERHDERTTDAIRARLQRLITRCYQEDRRLIYAGFGSYFSTDLDFIRRLIGALASRPSWDLILSLGGRVDPETLPPLPPNVYVFPWVPQPALLHHVDVAITHGGVNTIEECILRAVPMLIYCGFETDMAGCTSRVLHHGLGLLGDRGQDSPETIAQSLHRLLTETEFTERLQELRDRFAAQCEENVAVRTVESLLPEPTAHPGPNHG